MGTVSDLPPRGHYLAYEVGWLAGVSGRTIGQWARRGYIRSSQSDGKPRIYAYQDVAEAMVVHELLTMDVPHRTIKKALPQLRGEYGPWPLTHARLYVPKDASRPTLVLESHGQPIDLDYKRGQGLLLVSDLARVRSDLNRGGWVVRDLPDLRSIEVDPDRLSGRPAIRGTRVPAEDVARLARTSEGRVALREGYELTEQEIDDATRWWQAVQEYESIAS